MTGTTSLLSASVTRLPLNAPQTGLQTGFPTQLWFQIQLRHQLASTSSVLISFPQAAQVSISPTAQPQSQCYSTDSSGALLNLILCEVNATAGTVLVRNLCQVSSCGQKAVLRFLVMDSVVENYAYIVSPLVLVRDGLNITTTTSNPFYFYDSSSVLVTPEMIPAHLTMPSPEVIRTSNVVNQLVEWVFSFQTSRNMIPANGYLNISIPANVLLAVPNSQVQVLNQDTGTVYNNVSIGY